MNIIKIESRPAAVITSQLNIIPSDAKRFTEKHWDLIFYIDYEPSKDAEVNDALIRNLHEYCVWICNLGTYKSGLHSISSEPAEWKQMVDVLVC